MTILEGVDLYYGKGWGDEQYEPPFDNFRKYESVFDPKTEIELNMVYLKGWKDAKDGYDFEAPYYLIGD